ncbi:MAG TPA: beta-galactosidase [Paraburkholderia sp.]
MYCGCERWLQHRYESVDAVNDAWGNVFWSMEYPSFEAIGLPNLTPTDANPIHLLDFRRFMSDEVGSFHREQIDVLREHAPEADLLHNFMGFFTTFDHYRFAEDNTIDVTAWDSYPTARTESIALPEAQKTRYARTAHPDVSAFDHDRYRAIGGGRFWVMEQQAGPVNWAPWNPVPAKGMVRLWAYEAFAHGAELVSYFRWRQCPYAQEQMHSGLNLPNNELSPGGLEVQQAAREIASSMALSGLGAPARAATAIVFDYETQWMFEIQRHGKTFDYQTLAFDYYEALRELGLDVDIVSGKADLSAYRLVVVPSIAVIDDVLVDQIEKSSAQWVFGPRSGSKTTTFAIPSSLPPGALQRVLPMQVLEVETLRPTLTPSVSVDDTQGIAMHWREHVRANGETRVDARFDDAWPAVLASGSVRYVAGWLSHGLHRAILQQAAQDAGIETQRLADGLRIRRRGVLTFAFNFGPEQVRAPAPANATFVLGQPQLKTGEVCAWEDVETNT